MLLKLQITLRGFGFRLLTGSMLPIMPRLLTKSYESVVYRLLSDQSPFTNTFDVGGRRFQGCLTQQVI
jgi:hypothetical protein